MHVIQLNFFVITINPGPGNPAGVSGDPGAGFGVPGPGDPGNPPGAGPRLDTLMTSLGTIVYTDSWPC